MDVLTVQKLLKQQKSMISKTKQIFILFLLIFISAAVAVYSTKKKGDVLVVNNGVVHIKTESTNEYLTAYVLGGLTDTSKEPANGQTFVLEARQNGCMSIRTSSNVQGIKRYLSLREDKLLRNLKPANDSSELFQFTRVSGHTYHIDRRASTGAYIRLHAGTTSSIYLLDLEGNRLDTFKRKLGYRLDNGNVMMCPDQPYYESVGVNDGRRRFILKSNVTWREVQVGVSLSLENVTTNGIELSMTGEEGCHGRLMFRKHKGLFLMKTLDAETWRVGSSDMYTYYKSLNASTGSMYRYLLQTDHGGWRCVDTDMITTYKVFGPQDVIFKVDTLSEGQHDQYMFNWSAVITPDEIDNGDYSLDLFPPGSISEIRYGDLKLVPSAPRDKFIVTNA